VCLCAYTCFVFVLCLCGYVCVRIKRHADTCPRVCICRIICTDLFLRASWLVCCSVLQCVAVCCSVLQCVAVCCSVLQCVAVCCFYVYICVYVCMCVCVRVRVLTYTKMLLQRQHGSKLIYHTELQHTATHCNTLQQTATHCNTGILLRQKKNGLKFIQNAAGTDSQKSVCVCVCVCVCKSTKYQICYI